MPTRSASSSTGRIAPSFLVVLGCLAAAAVSWFQYPGALVLYASVLIASLLSRAPEFTGPKGLDGSAEPGSDSERRRARFNRTWRLMRTGLLPSGLWLANAVGDRTRVVEGVGGVVSSMVGAAGAALTPSLALPPTPALPPVTGPVQVDGDGAPDGEVATLRERRVPFRASLAQSVVSASAGIGRAVGNLVWFLIPVRWATWASVGVAAIIFCLPVQRAGAGLEWVSAVAAFLLLHVTDQAVRATSSVHDPAPGVLLVDGHRLGRLRAKDGWHIRVAVGSVLAGLASGVFVAVGLHVSGFGVFLHPRLVLCAGAAVSVCAMVQHGAHRGVVLDRWRKKVAARAAWKPRWAVLKQDCYLIEHTEFATEGAATGVVDTFAAPGTLGSAGAASLAVKLGPLLGAGMSVAVLSCPDTDEDGRPVPGSIHPVNFRVAAWPAGSEPDVSSPEADVDAVAAWVETVVASAAVAAGQSAPALTECVPVSASDSPVRVWRSSWAFSEGIAAGAAQIEASLGECMMADGAPGVLFFGAVSDSAAVLSDSGLREDFQWMRTESGWNRRWKDVLDTKTRHPWLERGMSATASLPVGREQARLSSETFRIGNGEDLQTYFRPDTAAKLAMTLEAAQFVTVLSFPTVDAATGRSVPGTRHADAFTVVWGSASLPRDPGQIPPSGRASLWALNGAVFTAFTAAGVRLSRPEIVSATALTTERSTSHVWRLSLRLYDGVTTDAVKKKAEQIRSAMGDTPWLRVTESAQGCELFVGAAPGGRGMRFVDQRAQDRCTMLDWEQAFIDAKLASPVDGAAPKPVNVTVLPTNERVQALTFSLPRGMSVMEMSPEEKVNKLRAATGKDFINVREDTDPSQFLVLCSDTDPMPVPAPFTWDAVGVSDRSVAFGTDVEGAPVVWSLDTDSHLLVLGQNGSGKGIAMTAILTAALIGGWEVFAADPVKGFNDFLFADPWLRTRATTYPQAAALLRHLVGVVEERKGLNAEYGVANVRDLPDEVRPPITACFIDELTSLIIPEGAPKPGPGATPTDERDYMEAVAVNTAKTTIGLAMGRLLREGRATGVVLVAAGQKLTADDLKFLPGGKTIKSQMSRLAMGKMPFGDMMSAFSDAKGAMGLLGSAVPRGRGIFESTSQAAFTVQTWWGGGSQSEHFRSMVDRISAVRAPLADADRMEFAGAAAAAAPAAGFGARVGGAADAAPAADVRGDIGLEGDEEVVDLGVADFSSFDFDAADDGEHDDGDDEENEENEDDELLLPDDEPAAPRLITDGAGGPLYASAGMQLVAEVVAPGPLVHSTNGEIVILAVAGCSPEAVPEGCQLVEVSDRFGVAEFGVWLAEHPLVAGVAWLSAATSADVLPGVKAGEAAVAAGVKAGVDVLAVGAVGGAELAQFFTTAGAAAKAPALAPARVSSSPVLDLFPDPVVRLPQAPNLF